MDENQAYFDNTSKEMPRTPVPKGEKGSGKGLFLAGLIAGLASTLLLVGIVYLGHSIQQPLPRHDGNEGSLLPRTVPGRAFSGGRCHRLF